MKKISKTIIGIPLKQTSPAAIERFLVQKVRDDLGEFSDLVVIKPMIRIDQEDGDLSGNITNGFGSVSLDVQGVKVHLPFIIHEKELLPFDVIRLGDQEVPYDLSKLRRVVNAIDKKAKESGGSDDLEGASGEVVNPRDINSHNGFLGTIMNIRDSHQTKDINGVGLWDGIDFGSMDDARMQKRASVEVDVLEVFTDAVEKIASVTSIPKESVNAFLTELEKKAESESQKQIEAVSAIETNTFEQSKVQRSISKLREEKLIDVSRVKSGNNIKFPTSEDDRFEYRNGRVYHKLKSWAEDKRLTYAQKYNSVILDSKGGYRFIKARDKFMTTIQEPGFFELPKEEGRGLQVGYAYATEIDQETLSHPFKVTASFSKDVEEDGIFIVVPERRSENKVDNYTNSLFTESFACEELAVAKDKENSWAREKDFSIIVSKKPINKVVHLDQAELLSYIQDQAIDPTDAKLAKCMVRNMYCDNFYIVPSSLTFFKLNKNITGFFKSPDGYFTEGPLAKTAAYKSANIANLIVEKANNPRSYTLEWQYTDEINGDTTSTSYNIKKHKMGGLSEAQARKLISDLGYDARQQELFFEISKRNGRNARFDLPSVEKAKSVAPQDKAQNKAKKAFKNIMDATLSARNFTPVFEDVMADGLAGMIANATPQAVEWTQKWDSILKDAFETAVEIEKVASALNGPTWHELSLLTNLKYQLDKMASDVWGGSFLKGADDVFEKVAELKPSIEKMASDLVSFNRQQLIELDKTMVNPKLVKQALHELDGLYRYASAPELLKKNETLNKQASFGYRKLAKESIKRFDDLIHKTQKDVDKLTSKIRNEHIYLRSLKDSSKSTTDKELKVEQNINQLKSDLSNKVDELNEFVSKKTGLDSDIKNQNVAFTAGIGIPGITALSYGYEGLKNK